MKYYYWVVYSTDSGVGTVEININNPITSAKQIGDIAKWIENKNGFVKVAITNFIFLREESDEHNEY